MGAVVEPGGRVRLRAVREADPPRFRAWAENPEVARCFLGGGPARPDPGDWVPEHPAGPWAQRRPAGACRPAGHVVRVIETLDEEPLGWIELRDANWRRRSGELRVCLGDPATWGRGYGSEAIRLFLDLAFLRWRLQSVHLRVATWNTRAVRAYQRCGFRREALLRAGRHAAEGMDDLWLMRADAPAAAPAPAAARPAQGA